MLELIRHFIGLIEAVDKDFPGFKKEIISKLLKKI